MKFLDETWQDWSLALAGGEFMLRFFFLFFVAQAKRGPSLFEISVHGGIHATWVFLKQVAQVFGVLG